MKTIAIIAALAATTLALSSCGSGLTFGLNPDGSFSGQYVPAPPREPVTVEK